jgi:hypothetical protein
MRRIGRMRRIASGPIRTSSRHEPARRWLHPRDPTLASLSSRTRAASVGTYSPSTAGGHEPRQLDPDSGYAAPG